MRLLDTSVLHRQGSSGLVFNLIFKQIPSPYLSRNWKTSGHFCSFGDIESRQVCMTFKFFLGNCCMFVEWLDLVGFNSPECLTHCAAACLEARLFLLITISSSTSDGGRIISHLGMECPFCSSRISKIQLLLMPQLTVAFLEDQAWVALTSCARNFSSVMYRKNGETGIFRT